MAGQTIDGDPKMSTPVVGLDRDGTINVDIGTYVQSLNSLHLLKAV